MNRYGWQVLSSVASADGLYCVDVYAKDDQFGYAVFRSDPEDGGSWTRLTGQGESGFSHAAQAGQAALANIPWLSPALGDQVSNSDMPPDGWINDLQQISSRVAEHSVVEHYSLDHPIDRIRAQLLAAGIDRENLTPDDLAGVDEFHLGGRLATVELLKSARLTSESRVLDVGSGIGGAARTISSIVGCHVSGVDLTPVFVDTATQLSEMVGMSATTSFTTADATNLAFDDDYFDAVTLLHVGMNIEDKSALFAELARVLADTGTIHIYDIMRVGDGEITYPVPWSSDPATSFVGSPEEYVEGLAQAGLSASSPVNRLELVRSALAKAKDQPPSVNLSHLMGPKWSIMFSNLAQALSDGILAPVEIVARPARA